MNITHKGLSEWSRLEDQLKISHEAFDRVDGELNKLKGILTHEDQSNRTIMDDLRTAAVLLARDSGEIGFGLHLRLEQFIEEIEKILGNDKFGRKSR